MSDNDTSEPTAEYDPRPDFDFTDPCDGRGFIEDRDGEFTRCPVCRYVLGW